MTKRPLKTPSTWRGNFVALKGAAKLPPWDAGGKDVGFRRGNVGDP